MNKDEEIKYYRHQASRLEKDKEMCRHRYIKMKQKYESAKKQLRIQKEYQNKR